jgi:hypothetical protein
MVLFILNCGLCPRGKRTKLQCLLVKKPSAKLAIGLADGVNARCSPAVMVMERDVMRRSRMAGTHAINIPFWPVAATA